MAFKQISSIYFLADTKEDLANIPAKTMGTECFVIKDAMEYKQTSTGEWCPQTISVASNGETSTFEQIQSDWNQDDKTAVDYIKNKPFGIEVEIGEQVNTEDFYLSGASLFKLVFEDGLVDYCEYKDEIEPGTGGGSNISLISLINKKQYFGNVTAHDADWLVTPPKEMFILNSFNNKKISFDILPIRQIGWNATHDVNEDNIVQITNYLINCLFNAGYLYDV